MKIPLSWLADYVKVDLPPAQLIERLTLAGLEVASVRVLGLPIPDGVRVKAEERGPVWERDKILVGEIVQVEKHPNADKLTLPTVAYGEGRTQTLVTGAPNIKVGDRGQKVIVALSGAKLYDGHTEEKVIKELKPSKIRGVPSEGMVCSEKELGISDAHGGIILLEDDAPVGMPLADFMGDIVLEIDVLPNMARCLSMLGVAREVAAIAGGTLKYPPLAGSAGQGSAGPPIDKRVAVQIENPKLSARYAAALIEGVSIGPSPGWMTRRLLYAGMRPISNVVDITNFVMLEWGQPLHAFDYDLLIQRAGGKAPTVIVRPARAGETLLTLDDQKRELSTEHLVIADTAGPIALAGVMGGKDTEVTAGTKNILLESASFDFVSIRRTFKHFNLPSEASARFSRGIHPEIVEPAALRAADLMRQYAGGTVAQGLVDCYPAPLPAQVVDVNWERVDRLLGMKFPEDEAVRILKALEFGVQPQGPGRLRVTVPAHRLDVQVGEVDVIEDLVRIHGYDRLPISLLAQPLPRQEENVSLVFEERLRDLLAGCGLQEVINYSLTMPEKEAPLLGDGRDYVRLKNPISSERVVMRQSVLAGVLEAAASNLRHTHDVRLFEIGPLYLPQAGAKLPAEPRRLALVLSGRRDDEFWSDSSSGRKPDGLDFFDLKGILESLLGDLHLGDVRHQKSQAAYLHPGKAAALLAGTKQLGDFGQLHPKTAESYGLGGRTLLVADLDVEALQAILPPRYAYTPVPRFPAALRDIAIVVEEAVAAERVDQEIRTAGGDLLRGLRLFDLYRGDSIPPGTKSLAYALTYLADDRTLTDKEVDKAHKKIEDRLKQTLKAQIRGKE